MTDLTPLVRQDLRGFGKLQLSDKAKKEVEQHLDSTRSVENALKALAVSVSTMLASDYFRHSSWFRRQSVHDLVGFKIADNGKILYTHRVAVARTNGGYTIVSHEEADVCKDYWERRLIEEVKVEEGIES